jgi:hypothetical protein
VPSSVPQSAEAGVETAPGTIAVRSRLGRPLLPAAGLFCALAICAACQSSPYAGLDEDDARRIAVEALREEAGDERPPFTTDRDLVVVRTVKGRSRTGEPAWLLAFARPHSSEIGCVWVWRPDDYRYEIDRCPRSLAAGRPPGPAPPLVQRSFALAFAACSAASSEALAAAYGLPTQVRREVVAGAVSSAAVGLLDPRGEAYRGCLAGMAHRQRLAKAPTTLFSRPLQLR